MAGPMHTVSSAMARCMSSRSAVECTATVFNPSSLHARMMRSAISPRLAMSTFCIAASGSGSGDAEQGLIEFDRLAVVDQDSLRSEEHTSELQSRPHLVCRLRLEKKNWSI